MVSKHLAECSPLKIGRNSVKLADYYRPEGYLAEILVHETGFVKVTMQKHGGDLFIMRGDIRSDGTIVVIQKQDYLHIDMLCDRGSYHEVKSGASETYPVSIEVLKNG